MHTLDRIAEELRDVAGEVDPRRYSCADAVRLTEVAADVERLGAAIKVLFATRATETSSFQRDSGAATPEQWLANVSGTSEFQAREALATAKRIESFPDTAAKLRDGTLSLGQASQVSQGASVDPAAEQKLLRSAERDGMRQLTKAKERVVTAKLDAEAQQRRARNRRHFTTWTEGVETKGSFSGPTSEVARLLAALEPLRKQAFQAARKEGRHEPQGAYVYDALLALADRSTAASMNETPKPKPAKTKAPVARVRVDIGRLLDDHPSGGEICEIPGVGPVPVSVAKQVLPYGLLELVLHQGVDVRTVVTATRFYPRALQIALEESGDGCRVRGCDRDRHLERHHMEPFAESRTTSYELLKLMCDDHHDLVTYEHYTTALADDGELDLSPPDASRAGDPEAEQRDTDAA